MKDYSTEKVRNVVLVGHGSAGKTSLSEAMLYSSGAINRIGKIEDGTTVADHDEEEINRKISLSLSVIPIEWNGTKINVLDTPGYTDFVGEVESALCAADIAVMVVDAVSGVEVGTELTWGYVDDQNLPRLVVINKMNRDNANLDRTLESLRAAFHQNFVLVTLPIGSQGDFPGVVDIVNMNAVVGSDNQEAVIPSDMADAAAQARNALVETAAEADDELILKYLEGEDLTTEEIKQGLRAAIVGRTAIPVFVTAATANIGTKVILDALVAYAPSPAHIGAVTAQSPVGEEELEPSVLAPLAAVVFKTTADPFVSKLTLFRVRSGIVESNDTLYNSRSESTERLGQTYVVRGKELVPVDRVSSGDIGAVAKLTDTVTGDTLCDKNHPLFLPGPVFPAPVFAVSIRPTSKVDQAKLGPTLTRICEEDPTLHWRQDATTKETILEGMGEAHVSIAMTRMQNRFGVAATTATPRVPYRETITKVNSDQYRHKKQTGGAGQFAEVHMRLEPLPRDSGDEFEWDVFGGAISRSFESSIRKGVKQVMAQGVIAGYTVVDVKAAVFDGKEHPVDSKDIAFQIAGREVFKKAMLGAKPVLLEPIQKMTITVPDAYTGDIMGDLNTKRARVMGMEQTAGKTIITARAPLAEIQRYATDLRSLTQGRGTFSMKLDHYEPVPSNLAQKIIDAHRDQTNAS